MLKSELYLLVIALLFVHIHRMLKVIIVEKNVIHVAKQVHYINREALILIMSASLLFWKGSRYRLQYVMAVYLSTKSSHIMT